MFIKLPTLITTITSALALTVSLASCSSNTYESVIADYIKGECTFKGTKLCEGKNSLIEITDSSFAKNQDNVESDDKVVRVIFKNRAFGFELDRFISDMHLREVDGKWKIIDAGQIRDFVN